MTVRLALAGTVNRHSSLSIVIAPTLRHTDKNREPLVEHVLLNYSSAVRRPWLSPRMAAMVDNHLAEHKKWRIINIKKCNKDEQHTVEMALHKKSRKPFVTASIFCLRFGAERAGAGAHSLALRRTHFDATKK